MKKISGSIVLFNNKKYMIDRVVKSFFLSKYSEKLYLIDHSSTNIAAGWYTDERIIYIPEKNKGYGAGHNSSFKKVIDEYQYHVVLNPDVYFDESTLDGLYDYMETDKKVGLVMPKVLYPDNSMQYLCKLLPSPSNWLIRGLFRLSNYDFEMRWTNYDKIVEVPYLSGCFMFIRLDAIKKVGFFDEMFFLHCEDTDLSRRIHKSFKTIYYPFVNIYHEHQKESHKNVYMLLIHIKSTIKYFNKWGWFFDNERKVINTNIRNQFKKRFMD